MQDRHTVAITGARGEMGHILCKQLRQRGYKIVGITRSPTQLDFVDENRVAELTDPESVVGLLEGCTAVIHLAALPKPWETYENILANNYKVDYNMMTEAARAGCKRFVYASTNHVQHGTSMKTTPESLDSKKIGAHLSSGMPLMRTTDEPDPDSYYAISKLNGENLGKLFARNHGLEFIAARIGWIVPEVPYCNHSYGEYDTLQDDPRLSKWVVSDENKEYMRAMYLGHRDCDEIFHRCVSQSLSASLDHGPGKFLTLYAVSNNDRRVFDLESTRLALGYAPQCNVEDYVRDDWAHIGA